MSIQRRVRLIKSSEEMTPDNTSLPFSKYLDVSNIILLGDPGAGKTHTFKAGAKEEGALFLSVRSFLAKDGHGCEGKTIYLDGLDEYRSRMAGTNTIIEVKRTLNRLRCPSLRLSCRVADWLGETDLSLFKNYFRDSQYAVISLEPLNKQEVASILIEKGVERPDDFAEQAKDLGIEGLLTNPQTLIMLSEVIKNGSWPTTKRELYDSSIDTLLTEHNPVHERNPDYGDFSSKELYDAAGAACASLLISGVSGLSLLGNSTLNEFPPYKDVPVDDKKKIIASLMRRAFSSAYSGSESVTYFHRTTAEFLAAKWLTQKIPDELPLSRVLSLICLEGQPASELRGLYAWLATLLSDYSSTLISKDPLGILMYGDPASLSRLDRKLLLSKLEELSKENPWFRNNDSSKKALGALSGPDMVGSFHRILSNQDSSFELRTLILDAISNGPPITGLTDILSDIIRDPGESCYLQSKAVDALLNVAPESNEIIKEIYRSTLATNPSTAQLRAEILTRIYDDGFGPQDVFSVLEDVLKDTNAIATGSLWFLVDALPLDNLPDILDLLCTLRSDEEVSENIKNSHEVEAVFSRLLIRCLESDKMKQPERIWQWLSGLHRFSQGAVGFLNTPISAWLKDNLQMVLECFKVALNHREIKDSHWYFLNNFNEITLWTLPPLDMARYILDVLKDEDVTADKEVSLYTILASLIFNEDPTFRSIFKEFFEFADGRKELTEIRNKSCQCEVDKWRIKNNRQELERKLTEERVKKENITNLLKAKDSIRCGSHLNYIGLLARVYFGLIGNVDKELPPIERLRAEVGDELALAALEGFSTVLNRSDLPTPTEIAKLNAKNRVYHWWYALVAGVNEEWRKEGKLSTFSDATLKAAFATAAAYHFNTSECQWTNQMFLECQDMVQSIFEDIARVELALKKDNISVLSTLVNNENTKSWRGSLALSLLEDFPSAKAINLCSLLQAALSNPECHNNLAELAKTTIKARGRVRKEQRSLWLVAGYLVSPDIFKAKLIKYSKKNIGVLWDLKDFMGYIGLSEKDKKSSYAISRLEFVIELFGEQFPNVNLPIGGWSGDRNPWDAAEFVRRRINELSTRPEKDSSDALRRLLGNSALSSYQNHLRLAIAKQGVIRREAEFEQPSWSKTIETLKGGKPANISDLFALVLDHLKTLKETIRNSNTDIYKFFWNCKARGAIDKPKTEDNCRDLLIKLLKQRFLRLQIHVEPEGHMVADKRSDIIILSEGDKKLPLELKRDTHADIWTACINQLERLYTRDPESKGYGIYGVFWFGDKRKGSITRPPNGIKRPQSAEDLEKALRSLIPEDKKQRLQAIVIDVTPPALTHMETVKKKS